MFNLKYKKTLFFCTVFMAGLVLLRAETEAPDPGVLEQERRLKDDSERQAQSICDSILGKGLSSVIVNVEIGLESNRKGGSAINQKREAKNGLSDDNYLLPWVPAPKSVTKEETPKDLNVENQAAQQANLDVKTILKRFDITVVHDDAIPEARVAMAKDALDSAFDRYKTILKLLFKATSFLKQDYNAKEVIRKNFTDSLNLKSFLFLMLLMLVFMALRFLFGPLADFMKNYLEGMREQNKSKVEMDNKSETETENESDANTEGEDQLGTGEMTPEEIAALEAEEELMKKFEPFKYVNDENIKQLAYLLHHEDPWVVAMVISYLSETHSFKVMEALPPDLQAKVALETALYRQTSLEQVMAIDEDIKQKIDFVVGGLEKLIVILESSDRTSRDNILEYLKNEKPAIFERVREQVLLFEDIANFPKVAMQVVVRELKTEQLARALRGTSPELQQKFFENMSQGAVSLLKEEMDYGRPVTDEQIEEERRKILDLIKGMESEGKISFRQKGKGGSFNNLDLVSSPPSGGGLGSLLGKTQALNPEGALEAYNNGLAYTEQGNIEEAIAQFESSIQMDPKLAASHQALGNAYYSMGRYQEALAAFELTLTLEPNEDLKGWVESLRASLSAAA